MDPNGVLIVAIRYKGPLNRQGPEANRKSPSWQRIPIRIRGKQNCLFLGPAMRAWLGRS